MKKPKLFKRNIRPSSTQAVESLAPHVDLPNQHEGDLGAETRSAKSGEVTAVIPANFIILSNVEEGALNTSWSFTKDISEALDTAQTQVSSDFEKSKFLAEGSKFKEPDITAENILEEEVGNNGFSSSAGSRKEQRKTITEKSEKVAQPTSTETSSSSVSSLYFATPTFFRDEPYPEEEPHLPGLAFKNLRLARTHLNKNEYSKAVDAFRLALNGDPDSLKSSRKIDFNIHPRQWADACNDLGKAEDFCGEYAKSADAFQDGLKGVYPTGDQKRLVEMTTSLISARAKSKNPDKAGKIAMMALEHITSTDDRSHVEGLLAASMQQLPSRTSLIDRSFADPEVNLGAETHSAKPGGRVTAVNPKEESSLNVELTPKSTNTRGVSAILKRGFHKTMNFFRREANPGSQRSAPQANDEYLRNTYQIEYFVPAADIQSDQIKSNVQPIEKNKNDDSLTLSSLGNAKPLPHGITESPAKSAPQTNEGYLKKRNASVAQEQQSSQLPGPPPQLKPSEIYAQALRDRDAIIAKKQQFSQLTGPPPPVKLSDIAEPEPEHANITQDDRNAITMALRALKTTQAPVVFGRIQYKASLETPWNTLENGASLEGHPASITTHTSLDDDNGIASPFTKTTIALGDRDLLHEKNPLRSTYGMPEHLADVIDIFFISKQPLHFDLGNKMKFTQTQNGIEFNGFSLESYQSKLLTQRERSVTQQFSSAPLRRPPPPLRSATPPEKIPSLSSLRAASKGAQSPAPTAGPSHVSRSQ